MTKRLLAIAIAVSVLASACSGGGEAATCQDLAVQTIGLLQSLIDDVDAEIESMTIEEFIENGDNLPSVESFGEESAAIDARAQELDCPHDEIAAGVAARVGDLRAQTQLGRFVINLLVSGNL
jgi:hypothetical protein